VSRKPQRAMIEVGEVPGSSIARHWSRRTRRERDPKFEWSGRGHRRRSSLFTALRVTSGTRRCSITSDITTTSKHASPPANCSGLLYGSESPPLPSGLPPPQRLPGPPRAIRRPTSSGERHRPRSQRPVDDRTSGMDEERTQLLERSLGCGVNAPALRMVVGVLR